MTMSSIVIAARKFPIIGIWALAFSTSLQIRAAEHPNILYIMADDHGPQALSCYGGKLIQTPNIDRLAKDGMRFTHAFANNSICSPSRAVLLTGKYNHLCGVEQLGQRFDGSQQTFPKLLQQAGYQTALVGKWHLASEPTGFDYYCVAPTGAHRNPKLSIMGATPWKGDNGGVVRQGYAGDILTDLSLDWIKNRQSGKPFCLMLHYLEAHSPHNPAERNKDLFKDTVFPEPPTLLDDYHGRAPEPVAQQLVWSRLIQNDYPQYQYLRKSYTGEVVHDTKLVYQEYVRGYLRLVAGLDGNVGRVLDFLDTSGLAANTIVIYASDNGYFLGEHGFYNKMWMYEEGFHIPMIVRMPGPRAAATNDQIVNMLDVAPTILDLAGVDVPADIQGCSMKPLIMGNPAPWRDAMYYHYYGWSDSPADNWIASPRGEVVGIRTTTAKLICYPQWPNGPFWELFDLTHDPLEMHNLITEPSHRDEVTTLKNQLRDLAEHYKDVKIVKLLDSLGR